MTAVLILSLAGCGGKATTQEVPTGASPTKSKQISEVSPPEVIQQLRQSLEVYQPQVAIATPQPDQVFQDNTVTVRFQVQDLPIFKNAERELGPHLHAILDNQPYIAVYDLNEPLVLSDLQPGTHTLRVFASRPWHESFKNEGAYTQTTFHIFTKTSDNNPDPVQPLLTYSRPKGSYGAEPILLDFYLTNAPLHLVAQENPQDNIPDWRIRCTVNGESFILDRWEPVYLKGFKPGKNWVQLEFLDEQGNPVKNVFNSTVRLIDYNPKGQDTLSKIVRGELSVADVQGIVDPNYTAKELVPTPSPIPTPTEIPSPTLPEILPSPEPETLPAPEPLVTPQPELTPVPSPEPELKVAPSQPKPGGFFNRFRRPAVEPSPTLPEILPSPEPETLPAPEPLVTPPELTPVPSTEPELKVAPSQPKPGGFFNRFRRPAAEPSPTLPEILPSPEPETLPAPEPLVTPPELTPVPSPGPELKGKLDNPPQLPAPTQSPSVPPTLPEIIEAPAPESVIPEITTPKVEALPEPEPSSPQPPATEPLSASASEQATPNSIPVETTPEPKLDTKEILLP